MSEQKKHAELIAELRQFANAHREYLRPDGYGGYETVNLGPNKRLLALADAMEAAHKREIDEAEWRGHHAAMKSVSEVIEKIGPLYDAEAIGNAAKLREAVEQCLAVLNRIDWLGDGVFSNGKFVSPELLERAKQEAEAALKKPARNCEKYATLDDALAAWREEPPSVGPFDNWLFDYAMKSEVTK